MMDLLSTEIAQIQADLARLLTSQAPSDFETIIFRAEMEDDNGSMTGWWISSGEIAHTCLDPDIAEYEMCELLRVKMAGASGATWKVMRMQIDGKTQIWNAEFEYTDAAKWDTAQFRPADERGCA
jgi:hypothetical protein